MSLSDDAEPISGTHVYTLSAGWKAFMLIVGAALVVGGVVAIWSIRTGPEVSFAGAVFLDLLSLAAAALGILVLIVVPRNRMLLTAQGIEQQGAFASRKLRNDEIAGYRIVRVNNNPPIIELIPKAGAKKMRISRMLKTDAVFERWLASFANEDLLDEQRLEQAVQADASYGSNPAERLRRLGQLRIFTQWLNRVGIAVMLWGMFYPHPYRLVLFLLGACPTIAIAIVWWSRGQIHIDQRARDKRPTLAVLLIMPSIILALRAILDITLLDWQPVLITAVTAGALVALAAVAVDAEYRRWPAFLLTWAIMGLPWSFGVVSELNAELDRGPRQEFETQVIDKHMSTGKNRSWYLTVAGWGPVRDPGDERVGRGFYEQTNVGDTVCVSIKPGAFGWRWYWLDHCATR